MIDYLLSVNALLQRAFSWWFIGTVLVPGFISVVLGYFVSNFITYRDQHRRLYEEFRFLRRRFFLLPDHTQPQSAADWDRVVAGFDAEIRPLIFEIQHASFYSAAHVAQSMMTNLEGVLHRARDDARNVADARVDRFIDGAHHWEDVFGGEIRRQLRLFFLSEHEAMLARIARLRPSFLELIDAPNFAWDRRKYCREIHRIARQLFQPAKRFGVWIDRKYAPRRSDCGSCCVNCRSTL